MHRLQCASRRRRRLRCRTRSVPKTSAAITTTIATNRRIALGPPVVQTTAIATGSVAVTLPASARERLAQLAAAIVWSIDGTRHGILRGRGDVRAIASAMVCAPAVAGPVTARLGD